MNYLEKSFKEHHITFQATAKMECIMEPRVQYKKDYHHVSNLSYEKHVEMP